MTWGLRRVALLMAAVVVVPVSAQVAEPEHLPRRAKPPAPSVRPAGLDPYAARLGVPAGSNSERQFDRLVDEFLLAYFRAEPVRATVVGLHDYDALFPATDSAGIEAWGDSLERFQARTDQLDPGRLGRERRHDYASLARRIQRGLADVRLEPVWRHEPGSYVSIVSEGIHALVDHDFAPLEDRTWNVVARLTAVPDVFRHARQNLADPPAASTARAVEAAADLVRFLANQLPTRVAPLRDDVLREEFEHHLASASGAAAEYRYWLRTDVLPRPERARGTRPGSDSLAHADAPPIISALDSLLWR